MTPPDKYARKFNWISFYTPKQNVRLLDICILIFILAQCVSSSNLINPLSIASGPFQYLLLVKISSQVKPILRYKNLPSDWVP